MHYWEIFQEEAIFLNLEGKKKEEVLKEIVDGLTEKKLLSKKEATKAYELLKKREQVGSTGIGNAVAIPHVKYPGLDRIVAAVGIHRAGIDYRSIDGHPVKLVVMIIRPEGDSEEHLKFLQWVSKLSRNADFRSFALNAKDEKEILALFKEMASL